MTIAKENISAFLVSGLISSETSGAVHRVLGPGNSEA